MDKGTLLDLYGPPTIESFLDLHGPSIIGHHNFYKILTREPSRAIMNPQIDPKMNDFGDPCQQKALQGLFIVQIDNFFLDRHLNNGQT